MDAQAHARHRDVYQETGVLPEGKSLYKTPKLELLGIRRDVQVCTQHLMCIKTKGACQGGSSL